MAWPCSQRPSAELAVDQARTSSAQSATVDVTWFRLGRRSRASHRHPGIPGPSIEPEESEGGYARAPMITAPMRREIIRRRCVCVDMLSQPRFSTRRLARAVE